MPVRLRERTGFFISVFPEFMYRIQDFFNGDVESVISICNEDFCTEYGIRVFYIQADNIGLVEIGKFIFGIAGNFKEFVAEGRCF